MGNPKNIHAAPVKGRLLDPTEAASELAKVVGVDIPVFDENDVNNLSIVQEAIGQYDSKITGIMPEHKVTLNGPRAEAR